MADLDVKHYMIHQYGDTSITPFEIEKWIDIEQKYEGLKYISAKGLFDKGKPKNRYTEVFADSDKLRVWVGEEICREATEIDFTFAFVGEDRLNTLDDFYNFLSCKGKVDDNVKTVDYWDNQRKKWAKMVLLDEFTTKEEKWLGSTPYIELSVKMQNIYGECETYTPVTE